MKNVKSLTTLLSIVLTVSILIAQEKKTITGRVISENLDLLNGVMIYSIDTIVLGTTELGGYFTIEIPIELNELLLGYLGMEWTLVKIQNCHDLEMIAMNGVIYDFIPIKQINRKRYKRFKNLPKIHLKAYELGIFRSSVPCISYVYTKH